MRADPPAPAWLREWVWDDFFQEVVAVSGGRIEDQHLAMIAELRHLEYIGHLRSEGITDQGLAHLGGLKHLRMVMLQRTAITDEGVSQISNWTDMRVLSLAQTNVTEGCLVHLRNMQELELLDLGTLRVTGNGLRHLVNLKQLRMTGTIFDITDKDAQLLVQMTNLERLRFDGGGLSDEGLGKLTKLRKLRHVSLFRCPNVTDAGITALKEAIPGLKVAVLGFAPPGWKPR